MAIAIIADIFMSAIAQITSYTQRVKIPDASETGYKEIEVRRWNGTVANLTLMALGSSAPEILLSIIEIVFNDFKSGELGPSTVVGSAAFNLMVICGVCVIGIPSSETRRIKKLKVFAITAVFSVLAYVWLIIILVVNTPDFVDLWEAIVTLLLFPILVIFAYILDKEYFGSSSVDDEEAGLEVGGYMFYLIYQTSSLIYIRDERDLFFPTYQFTWYSLSLCIRMKQSKRHNYFKYFIHMYSVPIHASFDKTDC